MNRQKKLEKVKVYEEVNHRELVGRFDGPLRIELVGLVSVRWNDQTVGVGRADKMQTLGHTVIMGFKSRIAYNGMFNLTQRQFIVVMVFHFYNR